MNENLKMDLSDFLEMMQDDYEIVKDYSITYSRIIHNYIIDFQEIYEKYFQEWKISLFKTCLIYTSKKLLTKEKKFDIINIENKERLLLYENYLYGRWR